MKFMLLQTKIAKSFSPKGLSLFACGVLAFLLTAFNTVSAQTVTIEKAMASGCYYYSGASKTTISVQVGWTGASSADLITVTLDGSTTRTIKPQSYYDPGSGSAVAGPIVTPQVVAFEINADGAAHSLVAVMSGAHSATSPSTSVTAPASCSPTACSGTDLGGMVFYDNDADGTHDAGEIKGIGNVTVRAWDKNGNGYIAFSDANGKYAFSAANGNAIAAANFPVRVEFTNFPANTQGYAGPSVSGNTTSVRVVASPACGIDCGGVNPSLYSQTNPVVFSSIYTTGNPLGGGNAGTNQAIIAHNYNNMTDLSVTTIATASQVGSLWAHAWNKYHNKLFSAAFLKRHTGLGPLGLGGIYAVDYSVPASPVVTNFLDVTTIGINVGTVLSNAARGLPASKTTPSADATTFDQVGKVGIGGMDLSDDGNTIYIMNLYDKKVYAIDITAYLNSGTLPTASDVTSFQVPDPGCTGGEYHPFALKIYDGKLYAGMVCDASTSTKSNLVGFVKAMDLTTNTWSDVFDFPLTYPKGYPSAAKPQVTGWNPWTSNIGTVWNGSGVIVYPTPMLSDIEFDLDGAMVIAMIDRVGHQMGNYNYDNAAYNNGEQTDAGGDILRAFYSNGTYVLENNAKAGPVTGYAPNNNQGPGFGEFYHDDFNVTGGYHTEMATGGLLIVPGSGNVMAGMVDPSVYRGGNIWANGVRINSNSTGQPVAGKAYYTESGISLFGKANGMGDIEPATAELTFLEIGNYVWNDVDGDGVQDPTETGIQGVVMNLYNKTTGALIKSTTTDANGYYYFSTINGDNILPNTDYTVVAGVGQFNAATSELTVAGNKFGITQTTTGQGANADLNDNNFSASTLTTALGAMPANLPKFDVTTSGSGFVDHSIDLGLTYATLGNYVWYDTNNDGIQNEPASNGINGTKVYLYKETAPGVYTKVDSTTTANDGSGNPGYYNFRITETNNYKVLFPTAIGNYPISDVTNQASQVDGNNDADKTTGFSGVVNIDIFNSGLNKNNPTIDAGYRTNIGSLGNYVWYDNNNDGLQNEPASNGINGIKVYLLDNSGNKIDSTITANDGSGNPGYYNFPNLNSGTYKVQFPTSVGNYPVSGVTNQAMQTDGNNDASSVTGKSGSVVINTASNNALDVNNPTIDAGYRTNIGSLGNYVWRDTNGDGLQNEPASNGTNGVKVYLLDGSGNKIDSTITANNAGNPGYYNFPNLNSGNYQVQFPTIVSGFPLSSQTTTPQTDGNSDANPTTGKSPVVTINTNSSNPLDVNNPTIDAGYGVLGSLGNYVWYDDNANGLQDEPASNGINGVKVILYKETTPGSGVYAKYDSTTTANDGGGNPGYYTFEDLFSANYKVQFPTSVNSFPVTTANNQAMQTDGNNDANSAGFSGVVAIDVTLGGLNRDNPTIDAGYTPIGSLGNYVWYDANKNGLQDEPNTNGINDIKVILYKETVPGVYTKVDSTITANDGSGKPGYYLFDSLGKGNYKVQFPTSEGSYYLTPTVNQSAITDGNNDANSAGFSGIVPLNPKAGGINKDNPTIDAGYYCDCNGFKVDIVMNKTYDCVDGNSFSFSANINRTGGKYFYSWDFGDGTTSTLANPTHTYATAGEYDVKLTVVENNFCGCRYEASVRQLYVGPKPVVNYDWQYNGNCLTYDFNSTSTVSMGWIAGFFWDFGNGTTSTQSNPLATFATAGIYNVKLVITTNYGCKDSIIFPVNIINKCTTTGTSTGSTSGGSGVTPTACNASWWSQNATNNCDSTLRFNVSNPTSGATYNWNFGDGATGTGNPATHKYAAPGNYAVKLVVSKPAPNACADSLTYNISVSNCSVTSGGGGGVESKTLGDVIAVRLYGNAINSTTEVDGVTKGIKFTHSGVVVNGTNNLTLADLVPTAVTNTDAAYVSTPTDLVNFTNAIEVLALDYTKAGTTKAVAFGTKTLGDVYSHTKPICDRLKGAELLEVKNIAINGFNLMAYKVRQRTGEIEYAINLSAGTATNRSSISLQSNWFTDSYQTDEKLYNFQLWAVNYEMVTAMATDIITKLQANGGVNTVTNADLPKAYVSKGNRKNTDLNVTIQNNTANTSGYFELREKANENSQVTTRQIPFTATANGISNITIPVKDNYEGNIYVYLNNKLTDLVYLADGTWALDYNKQTTTISKFDVTNETPNNLTPNNSEHKLFRNVNVAGVSKDYITVYKTMMGGGLEQNVSDYKSLLFTANATGAGSVKVTLVKKSITNWDNQYTYTIALDGDKEYGINLNQFTSKSNASAINANDIVAVNFSFINSRGVASSMNINLSKARFASSSIATDVSVNTMGIYPNPSTGKFTTNFTSEIAQPLVLKVIEASTGKTIKTQFINAVKGANQTAVELSNTTSTNGLFIVTLEGDNVKFNAAKLIVNKK